MTPAPGTPGSEKNNRYLDAVIRLLNPMTRELAALPDDIAFGSMTVKDISADKREVTAVMSTPDVDRYDEVVLPSAFAKWLPKFMANPVLMPSHVYSLPDGSPAQIGTWRDIHVGEDGLVGVAKFHDRTRQAGEWWSLYRDGVGKGFSVGWITHASEMREYKMRGNTAKLRTFTEVELLECSATPIPANRAALSRAAGFMGAASATPQTSDELSPAMHAAIKKALTEILTEPTGPVESLISQVVEALHANGSHGHDRDDPAPAPGSSESDTGLKQADVDRLASELRAIVDGAAK